MTSASGRLLGSPAGAQTTAETSDGVSSDGSLIPKSTEAVGEDLEKVHIGRSVFSDPLDLEATILHEGQRLLQVFCKTEAVDNPQPGDVGPQAAESTNKQRIHELGFDAWYADWLWWYLQIETAEPGEDTVPLIEKLWGAGRRLVFHRAMAEWFELKAAFETSQGI